MPSGPGERYDFFLSRRGSVAAIAREVADVLTEKGYKVLVQDYDIPLGASFVEEMHGQRNIRPRRWPILQPIGPQAAQGRARESVERIRRP